MTTTASTTQTSAKGAATGLGQKSNAEQLVQALSKRDLVVDLTRIVCVFTIVVIHLLMVGVAVGKGGGLTVSNPIEQESWYVPITWIFQIMPLFFVVGGFASYTAWSSVKRRGGSGADYLRGRLFRLVRPAIPVYLFFALVLGVAAIVGIDPKLVNSIAAGAASPLWFLAAYLICQGFVPLLARLHERAPLATMGVLLACAIAVDAVRFDVHNMYVGLANLVFVWLLVQQFGFAYATGWFRRVPKWTLAGIAAACYLVLGALVWLGLYSPDMLANLNPPTVPLILLGLAQISLLTLLHPLLSRLMGLRPFQGVVLLAGTRAMTIYLWHLPIIIALTGLWLLSGVALPAPGGAAWWWTRIPYYFVTLGLVYLVSLAAARLEVPPRSLATWNKRPSAVLIGLAAVAAIVPPLFVEAQFGMDLGIALLGAVLLPLAIVLLYATRK